MRTNSHHIYKLLLRSIFGLEKVNQTQNTKGILLVQLWDKQVNRQTH